MIFSTKAISLVALVALLPSVLCAPANNNNNNNGNNKNNNKNDPQTSLTLDPAVIMAHGNLDGQEANPDPGQVPSQTTTNNFINFCLTVPQFKITDGQQLTDGSCNPVPMGVIPNTDHIPSAKIVFPKNGDASLSENQTFIIQLAVANLKTGNFVNAKQKYYAAPQTLDGNGIIIGHSHVVVEKLDSLDQTKPTNPKTFAFFKGLNSQADANGILTANVTNGLFQGAYRVCSINTAANHQPVLAPVAQHGMMDDCSYFTVGPKKGNNNQQQNGGAGGKDQGGKDQGTKGGQAKPPQGKPQQKKTVTVRPGDTCRKIADNAKISVSKLFSLNKGINQKCTNLRPGQKLVVG